MRTSGKEDEGTQVFAYQGSNSGSFSGTGWRSSSGFFQARDLGENCGRFLFERGFHGLVVRIWKLAGFEFEIQVAKIFVDRFLALA
jgi:hypothetical protein